MNTTIEQATDAHVGEWILRLAELKAMAERIKEEKETLDARLVEALGEGTHKHEHATVTISRRGTVDKKRLAADYPAESFPTLYEPVISTDAMKQQFAPAALEPYKTYSAPSVTIR
ncbi:hypothetical protein [Leucobacter tenebrionis]|uniref:hypothetical protein n=1 Tax=Leucobacter tenebrionis TaxID=2873270 RepID=UPI001CA6D3B4|nr:hypothetical protein [Leucobacter tenebrionis]QZY52900.1 hypothetical protein KVY00_05555 [Leucobacter tenebrionis]